MDPLLNHNFFHFLDYLRAVKNASPHTIRNYLVDWQAFEYFIDFHEKELTLAKLNKHFFREYLFSLSAKGYQKRTIARKIATLRSFFRYLMKQKLVEINPFDELESPKLPKKIPRSVSYEEIIQLIEAPDVLDVLGLRDRCILELFYSSGLRVSELAALNINSVDLERLRLHIYGKGKKERLIPLTKNAAEWIQGYLKHPNREEGSEALFLNRFGARLTTRSIDRLIANYLAQTGLASRITPHVIRHTIATHWLEKGMDLKSIQTLLGHENLSTTTIYTKVSTKLKKDVYDKTHPRAKKEKNREDGKPDPVSCT